VQRLLHSPARVDARALGVAVADVKGGDVGHAVGEAIGYGATST
jgi:hypothetical protein